MGPSMRKAEPPMSIRVRLHGRIVLVARSPYTDEEVHRNKGPLMEHEHGEESMVGGEARQRGYGRSDLPRMRLSYNEENRSREDNHCDGVPSDTSSR